MKTTNSSLRLAIGHRLLAINHWRSADRLLAIKPLRSPTMNSSPRASRKFHFAIFNSQSSIFNPESGILPSAFRLCFSLCLLACSFGALLTPTLKADEPQFSSLTNPVSKPLTNTPQPALASTNAPRPSGTNSMEALDDKYKLAIGDKLSFRILEDEDDPKPLAVTDSGDIEVPYIGRYPALGKTCKQLAQELKTELCKELYFQATVIIAVDIMTKSRGKIYVVGPVRAPGPQDIPSDETLTVSKAILRAGGFGDFADKHNVRVTRKAAAAAGERTFLVDVGQILEKGKTRADLVLEPGDFIYVPERAIRF